jgi:hypothetical protein
MEKTQKRNVIVLSTLLTMVAAVFGWDFVGRAGASNRLAQNSAVAKLVMADRGKMPQSPFFQPPAGRFHRMDWKKMTKEQRMAFHRQLRVRFEAFLLEFAASSPTVQQEIVEQAKARFKAMRRMHAKWAQKGQSADNAPGGHGPHGWGPGGLAQHAPGFIAHALASGNPQLHAAATQFLMALHNG